MSTFSKAKPQQARMKMSLYGPPGSGKTFTALLFSEGLAKYRGKRIAYVDTERGTDFYSQARPSPIHPEAFEFDALYTRSLAEMLEAVKGLDPAVHGVVVIDSMSHVWEAAIAAYEGKRTKIDSIPLQAWGTIKRPYKELVNFLIGSNFDVFILGRQKSVFEADEDGELRKIGVTMRAEGETPYEPHLCARMEVKRMGDDSACAMYVEKDRTGVLQGRTFVNPNFATIAPLLPLLGDVQAAAEDEDERVANDAELHEQQETKAVAKEEKSSALLAGLAAKAAAATTLEALGAGRAEATKVKRSLTREHVEALRSVFESRARDIQTTAVGAL